jgi:outer membrane PBP1 activator LpoA protein
VNVFHLIDEILAKPRNNPIQTFEKFEDIETWLREQWSGLFHELLKRQTQQQQLMGLAQQVVQLKETNETLKKYLEALMMGVDKRETSKLIESEEKRLAELRADRVKNNQWVRWTMGRAKLSEDVVLDALRNATGFEDFVNRLDVSPDLSENLTSSLKRSQLAQRDFNEAREILGLGVFGPPSEPEVNPPSLNAPQATERALKARKKMKRPRSAGESSAS